MPPPGGQIINLPLVPTLVTDDNIEAPYIVYNIQTRYVWNPGAIITPSGKSPNAGIRSKAEIVQLHQPYGYKIVSFVAVRKIAQPEVPSPDPVDPLNEVLIWSEVVTDSPPLDANFGDHIYAVRGVYVYGMASPVYPTDPPGLPSGKVVYDQTPADMNRFLSVNYRNDLLGQPPPTK